MEKFKYLCHGWEDSIKMYLKEFESKDIDWIYVAQDSDQCRAFVKTIVNIRVQ